MSGVSLLVGGGGALAWGVAAACVRAVTDGDEGGAADPEALDAAVLLGQPREEGGGRVLLLDTAAGPVSLRVSGRLELRSIEDSQVLALPPALRAGGAAVFCGVVFEDDRPPLLVFDADHLGRKGVP